MRANVQPTPPVLPTRQNPEPTPLLAEALAMLHQGGPQRPSHGHLRALLAGLADVMAAAQQVSAAMSDHAACVGCPLCALRVAIGPFGASR
jgi:hypothetical protein